MDQDNLSGAMRFCEAFSGGMFVLGRFEKHIVPPLIGIFYMVNQKQENSK
jgi:hypothetical protein